MTMNQGGVHTQAASCDGKETTNDPEGVGSQASSHEEGEKTTEISEIFKTSELSDKFFDETSDSPEIISSRGDITQCAELPTIEPDDLVGYKFVEEFEGIPQRAFKPLPKGSKL